MNLQSQNHNPDTEHFCHSQISLVLLCRLYFFLSLVHVNADVVSVTWVNLPFYINGIIWHAVFCDWLLSFHILLRFIHVAGCHPRLSHGVLRMLHPASCTGVFLCKCSNTSRPKTAHHIMFPLFTDIDSNICELFFYDSSPYIDLYNYP